MLSCNFIFYYFAPQYNVSIYHEQELYTGTKPYVSPFDVLEDQEHKIILSSRMGDNALVWCSLPTGLPDIFYELSIRDGGMHL
jgi:hypothetical protein